MSQDIPSLIRYTSRVRRGFGTILDLRGPDTPAKCADADHAVAWMTQEWKSQEKADTAKKDAKAQTPSHGRGESEENPDV